MFADVAQQVLEYLGVPHDQPLKAKKDLVVASLEKDVDDSPAESTADLNAMFDDVNSLPADDPLRTPANAAAAVAMRPTRRRLWRRLRLRRRPRRFWICCRQRCWLRFRRVRLCRVPG